MSRLTEFIEKMEEQSCYHIPLCKEDGICKEESCPISEAIEAMQELQHYKDLEEQLEELFGGKLPLDKVVETLKRTVQNGEENLDYARILTNAEAEKWDRWKDLEEQGRLIEQQTSEWRGLEEKHIKKAKEILENEV